MHASLAVAPLPRDTWLVAPSPFPLAAINNDLDIAGTELPSELRHQFELVRRDDELNVLHQSDLTGKPRKATLDFFTLEIPRGGGDAKDGQSAETVRRRKILHRPSGAVVR